MKALKKMWYVLLIVVMIVPVIPAVQAGAASKTPAPAYHGKWTYYAIYNTVYKLDSQDGTAKKVKEVKDVNIISDISYYDGYLYFTANYYYGTDASDYYVCRMKENGTSFEKLGRGFRPVIYNKKIYYFKTRHVNNEEGQYDETTSISEMSLTGKNSRVLVKNSASDSLQRSMGVVDGKVYYVTCDDAFYLYTAMSYDIGSGEAERLFTKEGDIRLVSGDASYIYYEIDYNTVGVYEIKTGKLYERQYSDSVTVIGGKNGTAYFSRYSEYSTYAYDARKDMVTTLIKNRYLSGMTFSKSGYHVVNYTMTQEEYEASGGRYDVAVARMKINGKGFKILKKYFVP